VLLAVTHPASLRSMILGRVPESWAQRHAPRWLEEERARLRAPGCAQGEPDRRVGWLPRKHERP